MNQAADKRLPVLQLDPRTYDRALGCVHCGLCLPACPTYTTTGHEADSPRGRIQLMKALADGTADYTAEAKAHLDLCLDCRACETACPSEVVYHELIEETRSRLAFQKVQDKPPPGPGESRLLRWFLLNVLTRPGRLKLSLLPARLLQSLGLYGLLRKAGLGRLLPGPFAKLEAMLPPGRVWPRTPPRHTPARTPATRLRVAYFGTCVGSVMFADVNRKAVELLAACGAEVVYPPHGSGNGTQGCCGAIAHHNADEHAAALLARQNIDTLLGLSADRVVCAVAGCGAQLREYAHLLRDDPAYADKARQLVEKVRDVSEVLLELGLPPATQLRPIARTATYHDACHLAHGQRVTSPPRRLLAQVPGLRLVPLRESDMCCGAAGTYNLTQPDMASQLGRRKAAHVRTTGADLLISSNAGCTLHLAATLAAGGQKVELRHPVEVLHASVFGQHLS